MSNQTAAGLRERASRRVRGVTALAIAGATALTAAFTGLAAGSTHAGKGVAKKTPPAPKTVTAPVPSLTPNGSNAAPPAQTQQPTPVTPTQVTPATQPPVAVSGGS